MLLAAVALCGCTGEKKADPGYGYSYDYGYGQGEINFLDEAKANAQPDDGLTDVAFTGLDGKETRVRDFIGERDVVLVVTRGNTDPICPYCSTQTAHYIRDYDQFQQRGAEVLLVYPITEGKDREKLDGFLQDVRTRLGDASRQVPFPVLFDVELTAVDRLGIRKDLSKPATYIVDKTGTVRYAYVGAHWADRPSTAAVLAELDRTTTDKQPVSADDPVPAP
jgi:peroxiredoxin